MEFSAKETLERVKYVLRTDSWPKVAEAMGKAGTSSITNWVRRNSIDMQAMYSFAMKHGLSLHWLLTGEGPETIHELHQVLPTDILDRYPEIDGFKVALKLKNPQLMLGTAVKVVERLRREVGTKVDPEC